jgi:hypothetical protein
MKDEFMRLGRVMGYSITYWDVDRILDTKFDILFSGGIMDRGKIKAAIRSHFEN